jgi:sarcosine oxidase
VAGLEERFGRELVSRDGAVAIGPVAERRLAVLRRVGGVRARPIHASELAERLALLARWDGPAMIDEDGGVIRTRAAIEALIAALRDLLLFDEVICVRKQQHGRGGAGWRRDCRARPRRGLRRPRHRGAGPRRRTPAAREASAHVRLAYPVRGDAPAGLARLQDGSSAFGEAGDDADALPGNRFYAVGLRRGAARVWLGVVRTEGRGAFVRVVSSGRP